MGTQGPQGVFVHHRQFKIAADGGSDYWLPHLIICHLQRRGAPVPSHEPAEVILIHVNGARYSRVWNLATLPLHSGM
jgi:hypothetical protein